MSVTLYQNQILPWVQHRVQSTTNNVEEFKCNPHIADDLAQAMNWSTDLAPGAGLSITTKSRKLLRQGRVKPGHECVTGNSPAALLVSHRVFSFSSTELQLSSQGKHKMTCLKILFKAYWTTLEKWRHDWTTELEIHILNIANTESMLIKVWHACN
jgi:hypothetical protein